MNTDDFEARMRSLEYFHTLKLVPNTWTVIRVDGRGFSRFTASRYEKPFDAQLSEMMSVTAQAILEDFQGVYAYTESDEISVLFPPTWSVFDRELEKLVSLSAACASSAFTLASGERAMFDSRIWVGINGQDVVDYFRWRQADAARCALNGWAYWTLRKEGMGATQATRLLDHQTVGFKNELLFQRGINFDGLPEWQRRGIGLYWETYEKEGFNPVTEQSVMATRRRIKVDRVLPIKEDYSDFIRRLITREGKA